MNQAIIQAQKELIEFYEHMIRKVSPYVTDGRGWCLADVNMGEKLRTKIRELSSLPSDTQWIDKLEKEIKEEDKDIDSLDDYYMGMSVGKSSMLNRVKKLLQSDTESI